MIVTAKDLRFKISMLFDVLTKGEEVTITYRGKPKAKLISFDGQHKGQKDDALFGIWEDRDDIEVDEMVRGLRRGRNIGL